MKSIHILSKHGEFLVAVDDEDYDWLSSYKWRILKSRNTCYVNTHLKEGSGRMHRMIYKKHYGLLDDQDIDHKDRNGINNQKDNLRICNPSQNGINVAKYALSATSRFKGVTKHNCGWYARIKVNQSYQCIGVFVSERDAGIAYDIRAKQIFGEFAHLNVPDVLPIDIQRVKNLVKNPKKVKNATSKYFGVFFSKNRNRWGYNVHYAGKNKQRLHFKTEVEAATERDRYIVENSVPIQKSLS